MYEGSLWTRECKDTRVIEAYVPSRAKAKGAKSGTPGEDGDSQACGKAGGW